MRRLLLGGLLFAVTLTAVGIAVLVSRGGGGALPSFSLPSFGEATTRSSASAGGSLRVSVPSGCGWSSWRTGRTVR